MAGLFVKGLLSKAPNGPLAPSSFEVITANLDA